MGLIVSFVISLFVVGSVRANAFRGTNSSSFGVDLVLAILLAIFLNSLF